MRHRSKDLVPSRGSKHSTADDVDARPRRTALATRDRGRLSRGRGWLLGILAGMTADASSTKPPTTRSPLRYHTPLVRQLSADLHVDLGDVVATGVGGRVRPIDVRATATLPRGPAATRCHALTLICLPGGVTGVEAQLMLQLLSARDLLDLGHLFEAARLAVDTAAAAGAAPSEHVS